METDEKGLRDGNIREMALAGPVTREALYALVWSEPMLKVAARFGVSSSYLARVCTSLNVPRPERGYWAKIAVGKASPIPPLPEARPGDQLEWSRDGQPIKTTRPLPRPPSMAKERRRRVASISRSGKHPLIEGVKAHFDAGRVSSYGSGHIKPYKKLLVDFVVSRACVDRALSFANTLFWKFEARGHRVVIAPSGENFRRAYVDDHEVPRKDHGYNDLWSPWRCTVVYIGTVAVGLTVIEMSEEVEVRYVNGEYIRERDYIPARRGRYAYDHSWTTKKYLPSGRLCLQAYAPYPRAQWTKRWQETQKRDLDSQIKTIITELERAVVNIARFVEEGERQAAIERKRWEEQQEQWRREQERRRTAQVLKESKEELLQIIDKWAEANRMEQFFRDAEGRASTMNDDEKPRMLVRWRLARELVGSIDAFDCFAQWRSPDER